MCNTRKKYKITLMNTFIIKTTCYNIPSYYYYYCYNIGIYIYIRL